jgi:hypothetical protein
MFPTETALPEIELSQIFLRVRRCVLSSDLMLKHLMGLEKRMANYQYTKVVLKPIALDFGHNSVSNKLIHTGIMPDRVILTLISNLSKAGVGQSNPFNLKDFGLTQVHLKQSSTPIVYTDPLDLTNDKMQGYNTLFTNIREVPNDITYNDYINGSFILATFKIPSLLESSSVIFK